MNDEIFYTWISSDDGLNFRPLKFTELPFKNYFETPITPSSTNMLAWGNLVVMKSSTYKD
jgi:hypothetical protein